MRKKPGRRRRKIYLNNAIDKPKPLSYMRKLYQKMSNEDIIILALRDIMYHLNELQEPYKREWPCDLSDELWNRIKHK